MKRLDGFFIKNVVQGLGGYDVFAPGNESQNTFAVRLTGRRLCVQLLQEPFVPFFHRGNENDKSYISFFFVMPVLFYVSDQGRAFPGSHGRVNDVER